VVVELLLATREIIGSLDRVLMLTGLGLTLFGAHVNKRTAGRRQVA